MRMFERGRPDGPATERLRVLRDAGRPADDPLPVEVHPPAPHPARDRPAVPAPSSAPGGPDPQSWAEAPEWVEAAGWAAVGERAATARPPEMRRSSTAPPAPFGAGPGRSTGGAPAMAARTEPATEGVHLPVPGLATGSAVTGRIAAFVRRADPGPPGARALAVVGVAAAILAGFFLWTSRPRAEPVPATVSAPPHQVTAAEDGPSVRPSVIVHVAGKVRRPGVVTLPAGARVAEAIRAAGGLRPRVGADDLNLARPLVDGEQILVGAKPPPGLPGAAPGAGAAQPPPGAAPTSADGRLDLNTATLEQFQELPGVGPVLAQRIIDHRDSHGGFRSVDQLQEVTGIGSRRFAELKDRVRV